MKNSSSQQIYILKIIINGKMSQSLKLYVVVVEEERKFSLHEFQQMNEKLSVISLEIYIFLKIVNFPDY